MPELPELEAIGAVLNERARGRQIQHVALTAPLLVRYPTADALIARLTGARLGATARRGKFLLVHVEPDHVLAINPMLTGRLHVVERGEKRRGRQGLSLTLQDGLEVRYTDQKVMGKLYLVPAERLDLIPGFAEMGPEALSPALDLEAFRSRLRARTGQIKNLLTDDSFIAGVGNAYADEILWRAGIHPYRRRASLTPGEIAALHGAIGETLREALPIVRERIGQRPERQLRDFMAVHGKGGLPCPRCGGPISQITANQRLTNFCRRCQPDF